jgi:acyl-CoA synthetase (NDP forming)
VAVPGASNDPGKFGYMMVKTIKESGFGGQIYPVNLKEKEIQGLPSYPDIKSIPGGVDTVEVLVPARFVPQILTDAAAKGSRCVGICSGGFRELGNFELEAEVMRIARDNGIMLTGPNQMGFAYLPNKLNTLFYPAINDENGHLSIISQSGGLGMGLIQWAHDDGLPLCSVVNLGNQVDLNESDFIEYFADDEPTRAVIVYLEGLDEGRRLLDALAYATPKKPVVIMKCGRTVEGQKAVASHTGSLAGAYEVFAAAAGQYGAVLARDFQTLYDYGKIFACMGQKIKGKRLFVVTNCGGPGTQSTDEASARGLEMPQIPDAALAEFQAAGFSELASIRNPFDLVPAAFGDNVEASIKAVTLADKHKLADVILLAWADPIVGGVEAARELQKNVKTPLVLSYMGGHELARRDVPIIQGLGLPVFNCPERAVRAIAALMRYSGQSVNLF